MIPLLVVLLLAASSCDGGGEGGGSLDPLDLEPWGGAEDRVQGLPDATTTEDAGADAAPPPVTPCTAPTEEPVRVYFSRNVLGYDGDETLCAGQNLGLRVGELVRAAGSSVDLAGMSVQDDNVIDALAAAAEAGVQTRVFLDDGYYKPEEFDGLERLAEAGVLLFHDGPGTSLMHNKFLVVDQRWVWTGSANFTYYGAVSNANATVLFDSPALAKIYGDRFSRIWGDGTVFGSGDAHQWQEDNPATAVVDGVPVEVWFTPNWDAVDRLVALIEGAEESIHFEIFAFTLDSVRAALDARCGEVELVGLYDESQDTGASVASGSWCPEAVILPAKLKGSVGYNKLHHKLLIVDGATPKAAVAFGSMNWSNAGATENDENLVVLRDPGVAGLFEAEFATRLGEAGGP
ncbi:MAG: phospholipase D-like domain-containing protein [Pseudomonadota bacterium]